MKRFTFFTGTPGCKPGLHMVGLFVLTLTTAVYASAPKLINFQGILRTPADTVVSDGSYSVTFTIYEVPAGGTALWTETQSVTTTDGLFAVLLGTSNPVPDSVFKGSDRWLGIAVFPDGEMPARQQLVSVGYAYRVNSVDSASGGTITSKVSIGPGHTNTGNHAFVAGVGNTVSGDRSNVGGGYFNTASGIFATVSGGDVNTAGNFAATVGGGEGNTASGAEATVAGGGNNAATNTNAAIGGGKGNKARGQFSVVSGGGGTLSADSNAALGDWSTIGGGARNRASLSYSTVGGGFQNTASGQLSTVAGGNANTATNGSTIGGGNGNTASGGMQGSTIAGGINNSATADGAFIGGGIQDTASGTYATIGGGEFNIASGLGSFIGGGGFNKARGQWSVVSGGGGSFFTDSNSALADYSAIGGGLRNRTTGLGSSIAGGVNNIVSGNPSSIGGGGSNTANFDYSTVGGGFTNTANALAAAVAGGSNNIANGQFSFVGSGRFDTASGHYSTVPGGYASKASEVYSFAAGRRAKATHAGAFVWADSNDIDFASSASAQFNVRASGGTRIYSNSGLTAGVTLAAGASAWVAVSDSNLKRNIRLVDEREILDKVMQLPIKRWSYKAQDPSIEHIGPMAQDFYPLFQVGDDEKTISTIDPPGIALAAIQGLYKIVQEQKAENQELKRELKELRELMQKLLAEGKAGVDSRNLNR